MFSRGVCGCGFAALITICLASFAGAQNLDENEHRPPLSIEGQRDPETDRLFPSDRVGSEHRSTGQFQGTLLPRPQSFAVAAQEGRQTRALSGSRLLFLGQEIALTGISCPNPVTKAGRDAKALLNTFLRRAGYFRCDMADDGTALRGQCFVAERRGLAERSIVQGMIDSGLCEKRPQTYIDPRPSDT